MAEQGVRAVPDCVFLARPRDLGYFRRVPRLATAILAPSELRRMSRIATRRRRRMKPCIAAASSAEPQETAHAVRERSKRKSARASVRFAQQADDRRRKIVRRGCRSADQDGDRSGEGGELERRMKK